MNLFANTVVMFSREIHPALSNAGTIQRPLYNVHQTEYLRRDMVSDAHVDHCAIYRWRVWDGTNPRNVNSEQSLPRHRHRLPGVVHGVEADQNQMYTCSHFSNVCLMARSVVASSAGSIYSRDADDIVENTVVIEFGRLVCLCIFFNDITRESGKWKIYRHFSECVSFVLFAKNAIRGPNAQNGY